MEAWRPLARRRPAAAVLALHDHAANKYFGRLKIARAADERHPLMPPFKPLVKYLQARMRHPGKAWLESRREPRRPAGFLFWFEIARLAQAY